MSDNSPPPPPPGGQAAPRPSGLTVPVWLIALALAVLAIVGGVDLPNLGESDIPADSMCSMLDARVEELSGAVRQIARELGQLRGVTAVDRIYSGN